MKRKNRASTRAVAFPAALPMPTLTAAATAVMLVASAPCTVTMTPQVASRYASTTTADLDAHVQRHFDPEQREYGQAEECPVGEVEAVRPARGPGAPVPRVHRGVMAARQVGDTTREHRQNRDPVQHEHHVDHVLGNAEPQDG